MSTGETPLGWLRAQIETDLRMKRALLSSKSQFTAKDAQFRVADCEAKLAIIGQCAAAISRGESPEEGGWHDGRDDDEILRDEALAELADDILALLADGYIHRGGWADHWACPACGVALHDLPDGHAWAIPLDGGPVTCQNLTSLSPAEFTGGPAGGQ